MPPLEPAAHDRSAHPGGRLVSAPFLAVTAVTFLFFLYVGIQVPLIPRLVEDELGGSEVDIGLNLAVFSIAAIAIRPLLGSWSDRYGRRALMIGGSLVAGVGILLATVVTNRWALLPLRALSGVGEGALFVGAATVINDLAPPHRRAEAASYFSVAVFGGIGVGPIVGESLASGDRFDRGLVAAALCALAAAVLAWIVPRRVMSVPDAGDGEAHEHRFHRAAVSPGLVLALGIGGFATFNAFMPEHARDVGLDGSMWVFATYSVVCLVVRLAGAKLPERLGLSRAITIALTFLAIGLVVLGAAPHAIGVYAGAVLVGIGMSFLYPALMAMTVNAVPERERAHVISTFTMFFEVGTAAGGLLLGGVAEVTGKRGGFVGGGAAALVGLWYLWRILLPARRAQPVPAGSATVEPAH